MRLARAIAIQRVRLSFAGGLGDGDGDGDGPGDGVIGDGGTKGSHE